jgi:M6 family metalloprotease-like protein
MAAVVLAIVAGTAFALPPSRQGPVDPRTGRYRSTGLKAPQFPKELLLPRPSSQGGKYPYSPKTLAASRSGVTPLAISPAPGSTVRPLVVLLDFADKPRTQQPADFVPLFFDNASTAWSVANYWNEVSYGQFTVTGGSTDIVGWVRPVATPAQPGEFVSTITSYSQITDPGSGVNLANLGQLIRDLVTYLDNTGNLDFSLYADPATGVVQSLTILHAGTGQEDTGLSTDLYSHMAKVAGGPVATNDTIGGNAVTVGDYIALPEQLSFDPLTGTITPVPITPGVIVHEMGHLLGLPDLYPVSGTEGQTGTFSGVGVFDLMGYGMWGSNYLDRPDNPAHLSAWSKAFLGWLTPTQVTGSAGRTISPVEAFPQADKVYSNTEADPGQYFLVENRQSSGAWLFDRFLLAPTGGGSGVLIWQIDNAVIAANPAAVNVDNAFRGVYIKEADGSYDMALPIPATGTQDEVATYFGLESDYFNQNSLGGKAREFSRTLPGATVNSIPILSTFHTADFGTEVTMYGFSQRATGEMDYVLSISVGGGGGTNAWKTFNIASTTQAYPTTPMRSDDILSIAFDSGNNAWMGSRDQGIFRFLGTSFDILTSAQGLPLPGAGASAGATVAPIQAMAFESDTGSMWVGTERGLYKMRDSGSGFHAVTSFTLASAPPRTLPVSESVQAIAVRRGSDLKYVGTTSGFVRIVDGLTDAEADDAVVVILAGNVTAIAIDDNGNDDIKDDTVWIGFSNGSLVRSKLSSEGGPANGDPMVQGDFVTYTLSGSPNVRISSLAMDANGILWIGTDRGVQAFDLGDNIQDPANPGGMLSNLRDPYDFNGNGDTQTEAYLDFNLVADDNNVLSSNNITGIGFEASSLSSPVAWISHKSDSAYPGGASRFNANLANDNATVNQDERLHVYSPIPPSDIATAFGRSAEVSAAAGDSAGNVWFATTDPQKNGVVRFGNAGILSLDSSNYVNTSALARVTLQDDGLNQDNTVAETAVVSVTSASDAVGFFLNLTETGPDTGVFTGTFGFTNGATDIPGMLISVQSGGVVTVTYVDFSPPGVRTATATWKKVYPFSDSLIIDNFSCFISTVAFGSAMAPEVVAFRAFRDRYLMGSAPGRALVDLYYFVSPPAAVSIARSQALRAVARFALVPALQFSSFAVATSAAEKATVVLLLLVLAAGFTVRRGSRRGKGL